MNPGLDGCDSCTESLGYRLMGKIAHDTHFESLLANGCEHPNFIVQNCSDLTLLAKLLRIHARIGKIAQYVFVFTFIQANLLQAYASLLIPEMLACSIQHD